MAIPIITFVWIILGILFGWFLTKLAYKYIDLVSTFSMVLTGVIVAFITVLFMGGGVILSVFLFL